MNVLWKLKDGVIDYLSPSAKRRRTLSALQTPQKDAENTFAQMPGSEPTRKAEKMKMMGLETPPNSRRKRTYVEMDMEVRQSIEVDEALERGLGGGVEDSIEVSVGEDYIFDEEEDPVSPGDSISQSRSIPTNSCGGSENVKEGLDEDDESLGEEYDAEEDARAVAEAEAKVQDYLARQAEMTLRKEEVDKVRADGSWHEDEIYLFERLAMRSFEELIPLAWRIDFPTLPEDVFEVEKGMTTFVGANCRPESHARKALQGLLNLGVRVRHNIACQSQTERLISREIHQYIKWSEKDSGYFHMRFLPVLTVVTAKPGDDVDTIHRSISDQMDFLAKQHRNAVAIPDGGRVNELGEIQLYERPPPLLYGMIIVQTLVMFVTLDSANPDANMRHLNHFQFKDKDMDVWNGFAMAMMIIVARNYLMANKDYMEAETESLVDVDPAESSSTTPVFKLQPLG